MSKRVWLGVLIVGVIIALGCFALWWKDRNAKPSIADLYDLVPVERMDLSDKIDATGNVVLTRATDVYPAYEATVEQICVPVGSIVSKGELMMVLDSSQLKTDWADAESNANQARINLNLAQKELDRQKILFAAQGTTIDLVESAQSKVDLYREQIKAARVKLNELEHKPDQTNFMDDSRQQLMIKAPFTGQIAWISVKPGDKVTAQTLLLSMSAERSLEIEADVDESEIGLVRPGQKVIIQPNNKKRSDLSGTVIAVGNIGKEESGVINFPVKIKIENSQYNIANPGMKPTATPIGRPRRPAFNQEQNSGATADSSRPRRTRSTPGTTGVQSESNRRPGTTPRLPNFGMAQEALKPGMSADITILANLRPGVLAVPLNALNRNVKQPTVNVWKNKQITPVAVQVGARNGNNIEIKAGLKEGDIIAVTKLQQSSNGSRNRQNMSIRPPFGR